MTILCMVMPIMLYISVICYVYIWTEVCYVSILDLHQKIIYICDMLCIYLKYVMFQYFMYHRVCTYVTLKNLYIEGNKCT